MRSLSTLALLVAAIVGVHASTPQSHQEHVDYIQAHHPRSADDWYSVCLSSSSGAYSVEAGEFSCSSSGAQPLATGWYVDEIPQNGWGHLLVNTTLAANAGATSAQQSYAAGFLEGYLTAERVYQQTTNWWYNNFNNTLDPKVQSFIEQQMTYMQQQIDGAQPHDAYWAGVANIITQVQGIYDGYTNSTYVANNPTLTNINFPFLQLLLLQLQGETDDINSAVNPSSRIDDYTALGGWKQTMRVLAKKSKCSALVIPTPDNSDIWFSHTTWGAYCTMLRIFKLYVLPLDMSSADNSTQVPGVSIHFSSQPGLFYSNDDYYAVAETKLAIIETTNEIANDTLYDYVVPTTVPVWIRAQLATRLATSGSTWSAVFQKQNSGTYNNQWIILDSTRWQSGSPISNSTTGLLTLCSQLPGRCEIKDVSNLLIPLSNGGTQGYFASYNIPYFPDFYQLMGYPSLEQEYGPSIYSYSQSYRAQMFARETANSQIVTLADMQRVMQLNKWQTDPLSQDSPELAIASRYDLANSDEPFAPDLIGGMDTKITSWKWLQEAELRVQAYSGPTKDDQTPFVWTSSYQSYTSILGHPITWNFPWVQFTALDNTKQQSKKQHKTILTEQ